MNRHVWQCGFRLLGLPLMHLEGGGPAGDARLVNRGGGVVGVVAHRA